MSGYGVAELPLHSGGVPPELIRYMRRLARAIIKFIVDKQSNLSRVDPNASRIAND